MSVAFPAGYNMERSSPIDHDLNVRDDRMTDGTFQSREMGPDTFAEIGYQVKYLEIGEKNTLVDFLKTNRSEKMTWTIDGINYLGDFLGSRGIRETMKGNRYSLSFTMHGTVVI